MKKLVLVGLLAGFFSSPVFALGETHTQCDRGIAENRFVERPQEVSNDQGSRQSSDKSTSADR